MSAAAAAAERGAATQEIVRNVAQPAAGTGEAAGHVLTAASDLSRQSEHLGSEVGRFLANVQTA